MAERFDLPAVQVRLLPSQVQPQVYPEWLSADTRRMLLGLRSPALPARGKSITITDHRFHPAQTYTVDVNTFGDIVISTVTRNGFGFSHASGYSISRNRGEE